MREIKIAFRKRSRHAHSQKLDKMQMEYMKYLSVRRNLQGFEGHSSNLFITLFASEKALSLGVKVGRENQIMFEMAGMRPSLKREDQLLLALSKLGTISRVSTIFPSVMDFCVLQSWFDNLNKVMMQNSWAGKFHYWSFLAKACSCLDDVSQGLFIRLVLIPEAIYLVCNSDAVSLTVNKWELRVGMPS